MLSPLVVMFRDATRLRDGPAAIHKQVGPGDHTGRGRAEIHDRGRTLLDACRLMPRLASVVSARLPARRDRIAVTHPSLACSRQGARNCPARQDIAAYACYGYA
jgi:hypothetical protein